MNLFRAAEAGDLARVQVLVEQGKKKDEIFGRKRETALMKAAENGHKDVVRYLVEQGAAMEKMDRYGKTSLMFASKEGRLEVARYLLEQGADRDKTDDVRRTPLHHAVYNGHLETAKLLMVYGADLNARDDRGQLPIELRWANTEEIKQAIRDEPRRRLDHGHKRATEQDRNANAAASAPAQQEGDEVEQSNKKPRLDKGAVAKDEGRVVADEDKDSEPSDDEDDN